MLEMSRRANIAEAAEDEVTLGLRSLRMTLRVLSEAHTASFSMRSNRDRIERFRGIQPAVIANTHLARALIIEAQKGRPSAMARYDSARVYYERIIRSNPQSAYIASTMAAWGSRTQGSAAGKRRSAKEKKLSG